MSVYRVLAERPEPPPDRSIDVYAAEIRRHRRIGWLLYPLATFIVCIMLILLTSGIFLPAPWCWFATRGIGGLGIGAVLMVVHAWHRRQPADFAMKQLDEATANFFAAAALPPPAPPVRIAVEDTSEIDELAEPEQNIRFLRRLSRRLPPTSA